jgi:anaerobic selenocysteine-containing dehydrogenase
MTHARIEHPWGERTPYGPGEEWPVRVDVQLAPGLTEDDVDRWVPAASLLHSNGDAMDIAVKDGRIVGVRGRAQDRVNRGRLGPKDLFGWQANASPERLPTPLVRRGGELRPADWDTAMDLIVTRAKALLEERGPSALGCYTSGQLMLEEYLTQAIVWRAGIGSNHLDGNTRMCTATAGEALKESFGCDGQPGSYDDVAHADAICLYGHNVASTQPVLWMRILDRRRGHEPPALVCVDPRRTEVAEEADLHLAPKPGTNLALMNAIVGELIRHGWIDRGYIHSHTVGFTELREKVEPYTPDVAAEICGVAADQIEQAASIIGRAERLTSTVLQGFYQSHQATAAACAVNNIHLLRGMLGRPGCGVLQMNGQPTAENTRECGANGDLPGFRNWANDAHVEELAAIWNVEPSRIPHYSPPTHAMEIFRHCETGAIRLLWIAATNPAVSLPELARIRKILADERLFVVVEDIFLTETAELADVVLPAATWGEKTGTFTNADRTVHLMEQAVDPPGGARSDLEIWLDFARRMDFRDSDGQPLVKWHDPESAFEAWKQCAKGRPCDYGDITYEKLREGGIQWGGERLYADGGFRAEPDDAETYGKDLLTGAEFEDVQYKALNPHGRGILRGEDWTPPPEQPDGERPFWLTTGRTIYHFHTRTKTGRAPELQAAAPEPWIELSRPDAERLGIADGDLVQVTSARGRVRAPARVDDIREGTVFVPFHYGYWDAPEADDDRAANELTVTAWDAASKQPLFKNAAVSVEKAS